MKFLFILLFSFSAYSNDLLVEDVINFHDLETQEFLKEIRENALIKSELDLSVYMEIKDKEFPLNYFTKMNKNTFINSLRFNEKGLTEFEYTSFNKLSKEEAYKVLALFGFGADSKNLFENKGGFICGSSSIIKGTKCVNSFLKDHYCESKGTCAWKASRYCTTNC